MFNWINKTEIKTTTNETKIVMINEMGNITSKWGATKMMRPLCFSLLNIYCLIDLYVRGALQNNQRATYSKYSKNQKWQYKYKNVFHHQKVRDNFLPSASKKKLKKIQRIQEKSMTSKNAWVFELLASFPWACDNPLSGMLHKYNLVDAPKFPRINGLHDQFSVGLAGPVQISKII